jgi:5-formyltetrahydrofolate cyclo-ligase
LFSIYEPDDVLKKNRFGILEPEINFKKIIPAWALDIVFTPLIAFDSEGNRLGMGGGFYDRTFSFLHNSKRSHPHLIGLAYEFQN